MEYVSGSEEFTITTADGEPVSDALSDSGLVQPVSPGETLKIEPNEAMIDEVFTVAKLNLHTSGVKTVTVRIYKEDGTFEESVVSTFTDNYLLILQLPTHIFCVK